MIKINYEDKGEGFPIVLIHGLSDDLRFWDPLIPELSKNYRTITLDLRGHGKSDKPEGHYSIKQFTDDVHVFLLKLEINEAHFVGFSMGGAILQQLAVLHPQMVKSMVLMSSFSYINPYLRNKFIMLRNSLIDGGFGAFFDEILPMVLPRKFILENQYVLKDLKEEKIKTESENALISSIDACLGFNLKNEISSISKPVLILAGKEDQFILLDLTDQMHNSIDNSELSVIKNTSHNILIPQNVILILETIVKFLNNSSK